MDINKTYTNDDRKLIVYKMENLKLKKHYINIFKIIHDSDPSFKYTQNRNGVFIDIKNLSNNTLYLIDQYISSIDQNNNSESDNKNILSDQISDHIYDDQYNSSGPKLSNYEKNIIKRNRILSDSLNDSDVVYKSYQ